jgi:hypothetical protein
MKTAPSLVFPTQQCSEQALLISSGWKLGQVYGRAMIHALARRAERAATSRSGIRRARVKITKNQSLRTAHRRNGARSLRVT